MERSDKVRRTLAMLWIFAAGLVIGWSVTHTAWLVQAGKQGLLYQDRAGQVRWRLRIVPRPLERQLLLDELFIEARTTLHIYLVLPDGSDAPLTILSRSD